MSVFQFSKLMQNKIIGGEVKYISLISDESYLYAGTNYGSINLYKKGSFEHVETIKICDKDSIYKIIIDDDYIYVASKGCVSILDKKSHDCIKKIKDHKNEISGLAVNERYLATGGYDNMIFLYEKEGWKQCVELEIHNDWVIDLKLDENYLYSCSADSTLIKWEIESDKYFEFKNPHGYSFKRIALINTKIIVGDYWGNIYVINRENGEIIKHLDDTDYIITGLAIIGKILFVSVMNRPFFHIYEIDKFTHLAKVDLTKGCLGCYADEKYVYFGHEEWGGIEIWDIKEFISNNTK